MTKLVLGIPKSISSPKKLKQVTLTQFSRSPEKGDSDAFSHIHHSLAVIIQEMLLKCLILPRACSAIRERCCSLSSILVCLRAKSLLRHFCFSFSFSHTLPWIISFLPLDLRFRLQLWHCLQTPSPASQSLCP